MITFAANTKILIVDDYESIREMLKATLEEIGFNNIHAAEEGEMAWRMLGNTQPPFQLVISDWNMPKLDGLELLKKLRANPRLNLIPFILVTTENEKDRIIEAVQAGVSNYIVKPFTAQILKKKLESVFQKNVSRT